MEAISLFAIKSVTASTILFSYYWFVLRDKKFHRYNRFYLLITLVTSLIVPFANFRLFSVEEVVPAAAGVFESTLGPASESTSWDLVFISFVTAVSLLLVGILCSQIARIIIIKSRNPVTKMNGFDFVLTDLPQAPFSFLKNLFWKKGLSFQDLNVRRIFAHELTHIKEKHTLDKLLVQLLRCLFWMNPIYWFIQRELNLVHEFLADQNSIKDGNSESFAKMLLQGYNRKEFYLNPSHSFYDSSIKRRLIMITTSKNAPNSYARRVLGLPIILLAFATLSFTVMKAQDDPKLNPGPVHVKDVRLVKKATADGDSLVDVKVSYLNKDGSIAELRIDNIKFEQNSPANAARQFAEAIIKNPPDYIYYLNGKEISMSRVKKIQVDKVATVNIMRGDDAIAKFGKKAERGIVFFTTK